MGLVADLCDPAHHQGVMRALVRPIYMWSLGRGAVPERLLMCPPDPWSGDATKGRWLAGRVLQTPAGNLNLDQNIWAAPDTSMSVRQCTALHGFGWLRDLRALGGDAARRFGRILIEEWLQNNATWQQGSWDFVITARRLAAWLKAYDFFCASADDAFLQAFHTSLMRQVAHLQRAPLARITGTKALHIIRARIFNALCISGIDADLQSALAALDSWLEREIDPQGMHISRSGGQTILAVRTLIDIRGALVRGGLKAPAKLQSAIERAMHAIRFMRMPDGHLSCFQATREGEAADLDTLLRVSGVRIRKPMNSLHNAAFELLQRERASVMVDCGAPPAHPYDDIAHASPLAFEMSVGRERLIVNCATHAFDSQWAAHLRATAAHSTLTLDDRNACEIRPDGHIGRRPAKVSLKRDSMTGGTLVLNAAHDGYAPLNGLVHTRTLSLSGTGSVLEGADTLTSDAPLFKTAAFSIRFHLHPRVQVSLIQGGMAALLRLPSGAGWRFANKSDGIKLSLEPSIYCGADDTPRKTQQLVLSGSTQGGLTRALWALSEEG